MLMQADSSSARAPQPRAFRSPVKALDFQEFLQIIRRHRRLIWICVISFAVLGVLFSLTSRALYSATAFIYIDSRNAMQVDPKSVSANTTPTQMGLDPAALDSQVEIIQSEKIAIKVIQEWKLTDHPEFATPTNLLVGYLLYAIDRVKSILPGEKLPAIKTDGIPREFIETFVKRLSVKRVQETYVISIRFDAEDRELAANLANAVANAYLDEQLDARFESVQRASKWMEARVEELRKNAVESDRAVQEFRQQNDIYITGPGAGVSAGDSNNTYAQLLSDQRLSKISDDVSAAQRSLVEKQARYDQLLAALKSDNPDASVVESLNNTVVSQLKAQINTNNTRAAEWARRYGWEHQAVQKLQFETKQLQKAMVDELQRIASTYKNDLDVARSQVADLTSELDKMKGKASDTGMAQVRLRDLQREADAYRSMYQSFLDRYQAATQQQSFPITDARVLTKASAPREKASPKTTLILALASIGGLLLGCGLAVAKEHIDSTFRTPSDVERHLEISCLGVLPSLDNRQRVLVPPPAVLSRAIERSKTSRPDILGYVLEHPLSRFAETLRAVKVAADINSLDQKVKVIGVVSSLPGEGKSTIAANFANLLSFTGRSVLLIDGDLRNPTLSRQITPNRPSGLLELLTGDATIDQVIHVNPKQPIAFMPGCGLAASSRGAEIVGTPRMEHLIDQLRGHYEYIVIDLPPIGPVVDVRVVASMIDAFLFVIEWGRTSVATAERVLQSCPDVRAKTLGCVLNKTNMDALRFYSKDQTNAEYDRYHRRTDYLTPA